MYYNFKYYVHLRILYSHFCSLMTFAPYVNIAPLIVTVKMVRMDLSALLLPTLTLGNVLSPWFAEELYHYP